MQIGVYGSTDKRPVVYALLKLLQATGDVALFSNNRHYKRLLEYGQSQGHMANIMIAVSDSSPDEIFEEIGHTPDDFEHVVFDIQDTIPGDLSLVLHVKGYAVEEEEQDFVEMLGDDVKVVKLLYDGKSEREAINVQPVSPLWRTVEQIEALKILAPLPSKVLNRGLANLLASKLGMKQKSALAILTRRWRR
ncbi:hypothetical protein [Paenibacillus xylaniclasticus]|uniref:hypothetical protein n=1 Tax=Paenibacillus xylaniclasticus TaxID=588083 RepID=UPI000FD8C40F|nr:MULTISPECIES: hypothetical protein [Paenibacillus]GFN30931.1 hypothetical protein PCURB6_11910 [Paenibacillus curdlanolyticus]